jgi:hypothetical protein
MQLCADLYVSMRFFVCTYVEVKVKVTLRPTVSLGVWPPSGSRVQFFFLLDIFFRHSRVCYFVTPSLTRGQVCNLLLLMVLASTATLGLPCLTRRQVCLLSSFCLYVWFAHPQPIFDDFGTVNIKQYQ